MGRSVVTTDRPSQLSSWPRCSSVVGTNPTSRYANIASCSRSRWVCCEPYGYKYTSTRTRTEIRGLKFPGSWDCTRTSTDHRFCFGRTSTCTSTVPHIICCDTCPLVGSRKRLKKTVFLKKKRGYLDSRRTDDVIEALTSTSWVTMGAGNRNLVITDV